MNYKSVSIVALSLLIMGGCKLQSSDKPLKRKVTAEELISVNRYMVEQDASAIKEYVERNDYHMLETQTGLWYQIEEMGEGELVQKGDVVKIAYDVSLLDGTHCYSSDSLGYKSFKVGQGGVESGLEEGILLLRKGAKATFIMPPHRAHGLVGDDDKVPGRSTLLYKVELVDLKRAMGMDSHTGDD
ncbi:FKBP-type peptidyl-prolyl cis-trans isomerase [Saccharicrinis fermentans]|uniref:Peptidyl-prolyl cis-trans isomerase n=1 Tax=Saccharicrinis fermentans DSM 9555 = JCM 21142 TaxID=869213 RepID=W7YCK7_9BACT|nr:FKBP-type peptidyl-prolyl cis-trans isomerase [Saccharicrinis fermentans]GAF02191.1 putative FKBP-type peptidyl-prolyl cis-trans isomerase FkpA precursor [Saccharicrinis fermentans DSM 9555 = JCM 21142]